MRAAVERPFLLLEWEGTAMPSVKNILWTIGGAEHAAGTAHALEAVIPIRATPSLTRKAARVTDPAITGVNMKVGDYLASDDVSGSIPLTPRACGGFGKFIKSALGTESTPAKIGACIRIRYIGSSASCKIIADTGANTLAAKVGAAGSEADDAVWGGGTAISLAAAATDTVGELVTVIDAYADWNCEKVFGSDSIDAGDIVTKTCQAHDQWAYLWFTAAASTVYVRHFTPDLTDTERPTYTIRAEGYQDQMEYTGCVVDTLSLSAALKGMVEGEAGILGFAESLAGGASGLTLDTSTPLWFWDGAFALGAKDFDYISAFSINIANNHNPDGYGQGSVGRVYQQKGMFEAKGQMTIKLDADTYAHRASIFTASGSTAAVSVYFCGKDVYGTVPEFLMIELPFIQVTNFTFAESNGVFTAQMDWEALHPAGTHWDDPLTITMISDDSAAF
jgi:hypothetical protein